MIFDMMPSLPSFFERSIGSRIVAEIIENPEKGCKYYPELLISFDQDINTWKSTLAWSDIIKKGTNEQGNPVYYMDQNFIDNLDLYSASAELIAGIGEECGFNSNKCDACTNDIIGLSVQEGKTCYCNDEINPFNKEIVKNKFDVEFNVPREVSNRFYGKIPLRKMDVAIANYMVSGIPDVSLSKIEEFAEEYEELPEKEQLLY